MKIILATGSPYRQAVFRNAGIEFEAYVSNIDEKFEGRPTEPSELVKALAELKAEEVAKNFTDGVVIGFDSLGFFNGEILEKPTSYNEAFDRLRRLSGNSYSFFTGVYMKKLPTGNEIVRCVETKVSMRILSNEEIKEYLISDKEKLYKTYAQGFDPMRGISSTFIKNISGSYLNILQGIPLETVVEMLREIK